VTFKHALAAAGLLPASIPIAWVFVSLTATPLHPNPDLVPTVSHSAPSSRSAGAVRKARQIVLSHLIEENLPGLSVAVGIDGSLVWAEGFGFADLRTSAPVTPDHKFRIGTASPVLTSAAAGLLLENGRLKLDSEIQSYVPAFPKKPWPVTLREVMGQTAGVSGGSLFTKHCERPAEALPYFADDSLLFQPGTQYRASSHGWILMSAAIEAAADQPFLAFLRERIFAPLGMPSTIADSGTLEAGEDFPLVNLIRELIYDPAAQRGSTSAARPGHDRVTYYFPRFAKDPNYGLHLMRPLDHSCYAGAAVFLSTPADLVRFAMAVNSGELLQPTTLELLQTSQRLASGEETGYGLGWRVAAVTLAGKPTRALGHDGDLLGGSVASLLTVDAVYNQA
jgi:CubicO group peptidase (beta-lactamase class C family)